MVCPPGLIKQLSRSFSATALATPRCLRGRSDSPARPPLARVDSPNLVRVDSPSTDAAADQEIAQHHDERKRSLKRFRSFGSASRLALEGAYSTAARPVATPSPLHFATRHRTGSTSPIHGHPHSSRGLALGVRANEGEATLPPIGLAATGADAETATRQLQPPLVTMPPSSGAIRPPPILRPTSVESLNEMGSPSSPVVIEGAVSARRSSPDPSISCPPPPLALGSPPRPPPLGMSAVDDTEEDEGMAGDAPPPTPRYAHAPAPAPWQVTPRHPRGFGGRPPAPSMSLVAPGLYVGDEEAAASLPALLDAGITHVLNCTHREVTKPLAGEPGAPRTCMLGLHDSSFDLPRMPAALAAGVAFIAEALNSGGAVLVHCHRGISRSPTLAIAYLMQSRRQTLDTVFEQMRERRPVIDPNLSYMIALQEWESSVLPAPDATPPSPVLGGRGEESDVPRLLRATSSTPTIKPPGRAMRPLSRAG